MTASSVTDTLATSVTGSAVLQITIMAHFGFKSNLKLYALKFKIFIFPLVRWEESGAILVLSLFIVVEKTTTIPANVSTLVVE